MRRWGLNEYAANDVMQAILCDFISATRNFRIDRSNNRYFEVGLPPAAETTPLKVALEVSEEISADKLSVRFQRRIRDEIVKIIARSNSSNEHSENPPAVKEGEPAQGRPRLATVLFDMAFEYGRRIQRRESRFTTLEMIEEPYARQSEIDVDEETQYRKRLFQEAIRQMRDAAQTPNQLLNLELFEEKYRLSAYREKVQKGADDPTENPMLQLISRFNQSRGLPLRDASGAINRSAFDASMSRITSELKTLVLKFAEGSLFKEEKGLSGNGFS